MQEEVGHAAELPVAVLVVLLPALEPGVELLPALFDGGFLEPTVDRVLLELDEDPLTAVLDGRKPGQVPGQRGSGHTDLQLALDIGR